MKIQKSQILRFINIIMTVGIVLVFYTTIAEAADQKTTLMLGGPYCDSYPKEITKALMAVKGVKAVDLNSMPGHAIVAHDSSVQSELLAEALKNAKGDQWYCTGQVMDKK
ncbi:MAG TPA: heavy metal-associated domain-containing protein [Nitrospiria bacterium]|nr:heavy metal-associated domain-containing protein [Nitrospiria bacterium]